MDLLTHRGAILTVLFPDQDLNYRGLYLVDNEISQEQINAAIKFFLKHKTVLDPTIALDVVRNLPYGTKVEAVVSGIQLARITLDTKAGRNFDTAQ